MKLSTISTFSPLTNVVIATKQKASDDIFVLPQLDGSNLVNIQGTISVSEQANNIITRKSDGIYAKIPDNITNVVNSVLTENKVKEIVESYGYVNHIDYATSFDGGVVKINGGGLEMDDSGNLSVSCGTGIAIENGKIIATGTGNIDYGVMKTTLGVNKLIKSITIDGYTLTIINEDNTNSTLTIPSPSPDNDTKIVSGEYSNGTLVLTNSDNTTVTITGIIANVDANNFVSASTYNTFIDGDYAVTKSKAHEHSNKSVLDNFNLSNGNLTYNGNAIGGVSLYENTFTRSNSTGISWNGDIMTVIHNLSSDRIVNVSIDNTITNVGTKVYDGIGFYIQDSNTIQVAIPDSFDISSGTWKIMVGAMA